MGTIRVVGLLVLVLCGHLIAVGLFTAGFLLRRTALPNTSHCNDQPLSATMQETCWWPAGTRQYSKVVVLLVDALRYDFATFNESADPDTLLPFQNRLPTIHRLLKDEPDHSLLAKFYADPPTTTMQRLKGLTTGGLPTFMDAGSNFDSEAISEDNIITQLSKNQKKVVFMGDDTWQNLFPNSFFHSFPMPSFDVKDLHTVDTGVKEHLFPWLRGNNEEWDWIIAHFLGVDHCGHTYSPQHPAMSQKLTEMDDVINRVVQSLPDDSLLLVFGDHGMTVTGDHGGDTEREVTAAFFAYSKVPLSSEPFGATAIQSLSQIDLVPTLSLLAGIPIPFGSLGKLALPLLGVRSQREATELLRINAAQINRYLETYAESAQDVPSDQVRALHKEFGRLEEVWSLQKGSKNMTAFQSLRSDYEMYIDSAQALCRETWATFRLDYMSLGLFLALLVLAAHAYLIAPAFERGDLLAFAIFGFVCVAVMSNSFVIHEDSITSFLLVSAIFVMVYRAFAELVFVDISTPILRHLAFNAIVASLSVWGSSGYRICREEQQPCDVSHFSTWVALASLGASALLQWRWLDNRKNLHGAGYLWAKPVLPLLLVAIGFHWAAEGLERSGASFSTNSDSSRARRAQTLQRLLHFDLAAPHLKLFWPRAVFGGVGAFLILLVLIPLFYRRETSAGSKSLSIHGGFSLYTAAAIFVAVPLLIVISMMLDFQSGFSIIALCTAASAVLNLEAWYKIGLQRSPKLENTRAAQRIVRSRSHQVGVVQSPSPSVEESDVALEDEDKFRDIGEVGWPVRWAPLVCWYLIGCNWFYATGHQAAISNIHWAVGLIGLSKSHLVISGALIWFETFGSYFIATLTVPLLVIWPLSFKAIPNVAPHMLPNLGDFWLATQDGFPRKLLSHLVAFLMLHFARLWWSMLAAFWHRRHLMVWKVFAPRFVFDAAILVTVDVAALLAICFMWRVHNRGQALFKDLSKAQEAKAN